MDRPGIAEFTRLGRARTPACAYSNDRESAATPLAFHFKRVHTESEESPKPFILPPSATGSEVCKSDKMISLHELYMVLTAMAPLYVAMILAYGSVRWWGIFTPDQCSGINRFVAIFAVPLLSFHFISTNDPYALNFRFLAADTLQKLIVLAGLTVWSRLPSCGGACAPRLDWSITLFSVSTLPNTLVMGIPLLIAMYGPYSGTLMVQLIVFQCIIWYTLLLFLFEFRAARMLITDQFPDTAAAIASVHVDPDVVSLEDGRAETEAEMSEDGRLHVTVRRSSASRPSMFVTPRPSNLTGAEIYSVSSSRQHSPRGSSLNHAHADFFASLDGALPPPMPTVARGSSLGRSEVYSIHSARSNFDDRSVPSHDAKELHMFVWSSSASPVSEVSGLPVFTGGAGVNRGTRDICMVVPADLPQNSSAAGKEKESSGVLATAEREVFRFVSSKSTSEDAEAGEAGPDRLTKMGSQVRLNDTNGAENGGSADAEPHQMPPASVMIRLILIMVWRKLIRNPNTYSSLIGLAWSLVAFRWHITMPAIVAKSIAILSNTGLGMAMFSLGLFMALQPRIIACGYRAAGYSMIVRFLVGPVVMAAASLAIGLRGTLLRIAIVQATLPQGIVPFVFAKEYNVHPAILSTAVIFGMLVALPITLLYYIVLEFT